MRLKVGDVITSERFIECHFEEHELDGKTGKTVIEPKFDWAHDFSEGIACVDVSPTEVKYNYIDKSGEFIFYSQR